MPLLPRFTASRTQATTYLLAVCLPSIAFLVFLNASLSFLITNRLGQTRGVGDAVGSLGFADELVALLACPAWGVLSDRVGVRSVVVVGYGLVAAGLVACTVAKRVWWGLLVARVVFALGGAAT